MVKDSIFRAYDIRGVYGIDLTDDDAYRIGLAYGKYIGKGKRITIGSDVRISGESLKNNFINGVIDAGCYVVDIGIVATPILYFSIVHGGYDGGVMVTASHNPPEWNGFKLCRERGLVIGEGIGMENIKSLTLNPNLKPNASRGIATRYYNIIDDYVSFIMRLIKIKRSLKVGVDLSNGAGVFVVPRLLEIAKCKYLVLNGEADGRFPGHIPEPNDETLKQLKDLVVDKKLDIGIGFDGDADRAVFIDNNGNIVPGDIALVIFAKHYLPKTKRGKVVFEVSCSRIVEEVVRDLGGIPIESRVGHAYITQLMISEKAEIGGEKSSHFYFKDTYGFDDSIYAAMKMIEILSLSNKSFSEIVDEIPKYYSSPVKTYSCPDNLKFEIVEKIKKHFKEKGYKTIEIDGVKAILDNGWILIRPSNTQPQIKITVEAKTLKDLDKLLKYAETILRNTLMK
ncbi:MAG: phosphomannomutase/phosphoglucomutase [Candidatus Methanomethylicia archaeon]